MRINESSYKTATALRNVSPILNRYTFPNMPAWVLQHEFVESMKLGEKKGVIYITAPAGYGKTSSVREWVINKAKPYSYISLDEFDNTTQDFLSKIFTALSYFLPLDEGMETANVHNTSESNIGMLCDKLSEANNNYIIIFDNLQIINNAEVFEILYCLAKKAGHILFILISRFYPQGRMIDLQREAEFHLVNQECLRYRADEFTYIMEKNKFYLPRDEMERLYVQTEGWPLCVGALVQSNAKSKHMEASLCKYIKAELWSRCDRAMREFLLKVSISDFLCEGICANLTGRNSCSSILNRLHSENIFISKTESDGYRLHGFFRKFLLSMAYKEDYIQVNSLYQRAADWHFKHDQYYRAAEYYFLGEALQNAEQAARLLLCADKSTNSLPDFAIQLNALSFVGYPAETLMDYPWLLCAAACGCYLSGNLEMFMQYYDRLTKTIHSYNGTDKEDVTRIFVFLGNLDSRKNSLLLINDINSDPSVLDLYKVIPSQYLRYEFGFWRSDVFRYAALAGLSLQKGDYARARELAFSPEMESLENLCAIMIRAEVMYAEGKSKDAERLLADAQNSLKSANNDCILYGVKALRAKHCLRMGDGRTAREWISQNGINSTFSTIALHDVCIHITTAHALILVDETEQALLLLGKLRNQALRYNRIIDLIEACLLSAIAHELDQNMESALESMSYALEYAQIYGFTEVFISQAKDIYRILNELSFRKSREGNIDKLDSEFLRSLCILTGKKLGRRQVMRLYQKQPDFKLTAKQTLVAQLLVKGHSYQEIADNLKLKLSTTKSYIREIYNKLGVFSIDEAVERLYETGVIREEV